MPKKKKGGKEGKKKGKEATQASSNDAEKKQFEVPSSTDKELALKQEWVFEIYDKNKNDIKLFSS